MSQYDLLIKGGEVIIPATGFRGRQDLAVQGDTIAMIAPNMDPATASQVIDAAGMLVTPGLIDFHTHLGYEVHRRVVSAEEVCPASGVTTAVDQGSVGAFTFDWYRRRVLASCAVRLYSFINIASIGITAVHNPYYVDYYGEYVDRDVTIEVIERNKEFIKGIKVFGTSAMVGVWALDAIKAAVDVGTATDLPVTVHVSVEPPTLEQILALLRPGDIITHSLTPHNQGILVDGVLRPAVREARERGVLFDMGHGSGSFSFEVARRALEQGFLPDTISTDVYHDNVEGPVKDLVTTMGKLLALGVSLEEVLKRVTTNAAQALRMPELGTLAVGGPADIALLSMQEGSFPLTDSRQETVQGAVRLKGEATICRGRVIYERRGDVG